MVAERQVCAEGAGPTGRAGRGSGGVVAERCIETVGNRAVAVHL